MGKKNTITKSGVLNIKIFYGLITFFMIGIMFMSSNVMAGEDMDTQDSVLTLVIPSTCNLSIVDPNPSKTLESGVDVDLAFNNGYVDFDQGKPTLKVSANKQWVLTAKSNGFNAVDGYSKNVGDLQLKDLGTNNAIINSFTSLSGSELSIASSLKGIKADTHPIQYRILLDWGKDVPGTYAAVVTYTLTTRGS